MYITSAFMSDRLYELSEEASVAGRRSRSLREGRKEGEPRFNRYWSKYVRRSPAFRTEEKSDSTGGIGPISGMESNLTLRRFGSGSMMVGGNAERMTLRS